MKKNNKKDAIKKPTRAFSGKEIDNSSEKENIRVIDTETSDYLTELKHRKIENKPVEITSEMKDAMVQDEPSSVDSDVERYYDTKITEGLSDEQVASRVEQGLSNLVTDDKGQTILGIILKNIFTFFNMLYIVIAIVLIIAGAGIGNFAFVPVVFMNILIGIIQQIKAKMTVEKMTLMSAPTATVIRNGQKIEISVTDVVLDDIIFFTPGKQICADSIVVEGNVEVNEALLTGESDAIAKTPGSKLFSGSFISSGVCIARVDKVGKDNYIEKISSDAKRYTPPKSELLRTLNGIIKGITLLIIPISFLYIYIYNKGSNIQGFMAVLKGPVLNTSYLILAMIPSGLFLLTSATLALSVVSLAKNNTLVQELYCIEMLARVDVLCLDKTGTITDGTMRVCDCVEVQNYTDYTIREIIGSMMNAFEDTNPTSEALIKYFETNNVLTATEVIPFSSKRKFSAVTFEDFGTCAIGAPDFVLKENYDMVKSKVERFSSQGCRVVVLAHTRYKVLNDTLPTGMKPLALIVIQDHIRDDAADTIKFFKMNGVDIKVISGDNPETVSKIAERVGISESHRYINLNGVTDEEIRESIFDYTVFGRVTPSQKRVIVQALKERGKTVAMTGDGVNDILALKEADCSIAMASGSEATRYVSHLVLMDSNFASMPKVVNEGRRVINNVQKVSAIYLTKNLFAMLLAVMFIIIGALALGDGKISQLTITYPFKSSHLMVIEFFIVGFATFALALQPNRAIVKGKFLKNVIRDIIPGAVTILFFNIILYVVKDIRVGEAKELLFVNLRDENVYLTIAALIDTMIMLIVLYESCKPFNWYRKAVFGIVVVGALLFVVFLGTRIMELGFGSFGNTEWLLLIILLLLAQPMITFVRWFLSVLHVTPKQKKNN